VSDPIAWSKAERASPFQTQQGRRPGSGSGPSEKGEYGPFEWAGAGGRRRICVCCGLRAAGGWGCRLSLFIYIYPGGLGRVARRGRSAGMLAAVCCVHGGPCRLLCWCVKYTSEPLTEIHYLNAKTRVLTTESRPGTKISSREWPARRPLRAVSYGSGPKPTSTQQSLMRTPILSSTGASRAANRLYYLSAKKVQSVSGSLLYLTVQDRHTRCSTFAFSS